MPDLSPKPFSYMPIRLSPFDRITIGTKHYRLSREYDGEIILVSVEETPRYETFSELEFYQMHCLGKAKVTEGEYSSSRKLYSSNPDVTFRSHKPHKRARALFYVELFKAYERLASGMGGLARSVDELGPHMDSLVLKALSITHTLMAEGKPLESISVSVGHFNKMYKMFIEANRKTDILISNDAGPKRRHQVDAEALAIWQTYAEGYAHPNRPSKKDQHESLLAELDRVNKERRAEGKNLLPVPTYKVFRGFLNKLGAYHVYCKRYSRAAADRKFGFTKGGFGFFRPGERIDIDEKRVDLMTLLQYASVWETLSDDEKNTVRRIRLWVVVAIDIATRYILAMRFCTRPNAKTTLDVIRMMMEDKREMSEYVGALGPWVGRCRPEAIYTDNGSGLVNDEVAEVLVECEIEHTRPAAGQPQARGHVESSFRGHNRIVRHFQGRTFKDVVEKGDYDPVRAAALPIDDAEHKYARGILDIYHNTPHEGLGGETPHNAWVRQTQLYKMRPLIEPDVMRHIFGMDDTRTLDGAGLRFMGVQYHSPILAQWLLDEGQVEVPVRIDMGTMSSISFQKDGMWYIADNQIGLPQGISVPEWMRAWKIVGEKFANSTSVTLDPFYAALRELRESGEAAALANPLGIREMTIEKVRDSERALLHRAGFTVRASAEPILALDPPVARKSAFVRADAPGFTDIVGEVAAQEAIEQKAKAQPARKPPIGENGPSSIGSADDLTF